jgi:hypothetical protein
MIMCRNRKLPSGAIAMPIDLQAAEKACGQYYMELVNVGLTQINSYWARLVFSGKATVAAGVALIVFLLVTRTSAAYPTRFSLSRD